jgi:hypothetical protein
MERRIFMENDKLVRLSDVAKLKLKYAENDDVRDGWFCAIDAVMNLPAVDAVVVRHARWIPEALGDMRCSGCNEVYGVCGGLLGDYNYCPGCGARMDGRREE